MNKFCIGILLLIVTVATVGCGNGGETAATSTEMGNQPLAIALGPETSRYLLDDVFKGDIQFAASVENQGDADITFAHPVICFPEEYRIGDSLNLREYHGKSELLLTVEKPDGSVAILRGGPNFFDSDNESLFTIKPGESDLFYIGWFFQNARGGWEDDIKAESVFTGRGEYRLSLLYRNVFPKALVHDNTTGQSRFTPVWTGELQSNTITVTIQ